MIQVAQTHTIAALTAVAVLFPLSDEPASGQAFLLDEETLGLEAPETGWTPDEQDAVDFIVAKAQCEHPTKQHRLADGTWRLESHGNWVIFGEGGFQLTEETRISIIDRKKNYIDHTVIRYVSSGRLQDLSPRISAEGPIVHLECTKGACFNVSETTQFLPDPPFDTIESPTADAQAYDFCSDEMAQRVAKAFTFLISSRGGKEPPF